MAKNRKYQAGTVRFAPALKAFLLCAFIGGSTVGYVWQKEQIQKLSREKKEREIILDRLIQRNKMQQGQLAVLISPRQLEARLNKLNLGLVQPPLSQIVRLVETPPHAVASMASEKNIIGTQLALVSP